jgi:hypothetical protein
MTNKRTTAQLAADKRRTGRPTKSPSRRQNKKVTIYMTPAELKRLEVQATEEGVSLSALMMKPWRNEGV